MILNLIWWKTNNYRKTISDTLPSNFCAKDQRCMFMDFFLYVISHEKIDSLLFSSQFFCDHLELF